MSKREELSQGSMAERPYGKTRSPVNVTISRAAAPEESRNAKAEREVSRHGLEITSYLGVSSVPILDAQFRVRMETNNSIDKKRLPVSLLARID
jgi:hypothetical protein